VVGTDTLFCWPKPYYLSKASHIALRAPKVTGECKKCYWICSKGG
jgi:hypothetical protein